MSKEVQSEVDRILRRVLPQIRQEILRTVRAKQAARYAHSPSKPRKKSIRILTLESLSQSAKSREEIYKWILAYVKAPVLARKRIENNININLHTLANNRLITKAKERGGKFSLTALGKESVA